MVKKEDIRDVFNQIINGKTIKSYSHKPHLAELPYDLNTNDVSKLEERVIATSRAMQRTSNEILNYSSELADSISHVEKNDKNCKDNMKSAQNNLKSLKSELNDYTGDYVDTTKYLQDLCDSYDNIMPRIFDKYDKYLKKNNSERVNESIVKGESELRELAEKFGEIAHHNSPFKGAHITDNSKIVKHSDNISTSTIEAIRSHNDSLNQEKFIKQRIKDEDVAIRKMNDYENHLDRITEKLGNLSNLNSVDKQKVEYLNRLIQQSKEDYHISNNPFKD